MADAPDAPPPSSSDAYIDWLADRFRSHGRQHVIAACDHSEIREYLETHTAPLHEVAPDQVMKSLEGCSLPFLVFFSQGPCASLAKHIVKEPETMGIWLPLFEHLGERTCIVSMVLPLMTVLVISLLRSPSEVVSNRIVNIFVAFSLYNEEHEFAICQRKVLTTLKSSMRFTRMDIWNAAIRILAASQAHIAFPVVFDAMTFINDLVDFACHPNWQSLSAIPVCFEMLSVAIQRPFSQTYLDGPMFGKVLHIHDFNDACLPFVKEWSRANPIGLLLNMMHSNVLDQFLLHVWENPAWKDACFKLLYDAWPAKLQECYNLPPLAKKSKSARTTRSSSRKMECPITKECMEDPVVASDGHIYERDAILEHLSHSNVSPMTREILRWWIKPVFALR